MSEMQHNLHSVPSSSWGLRRAAKKEREDPLFYGWRFRRHDDGGIERVPRSRADFLNPREGDEMGQDSLHFALTLIFYTLFRRRYPTGGNITVFADLLTRFAKKSLNDATPDVFLVSGVEDPERRRRSFQEAKESGKIQLAVEIVSPDYAFKDYEHNPPLYEQAGIREYLIVHLLGDYLTGPYKLSGYRLDEVTKTYQPIQPDAQGRLYSVVTDLYISADPESWGLAIVDRATGERVLTDQEALEATERRLGEAERRASEAKRWAEAEALARGLAEKRTAAVEDENRRLSAEIARLKGGSL